MPQDAITISYLAKELDNLLKGGRISKINQPEIDEVHFQVRTLNGNKKFVLSANGNSPRCHMTQEIKQNPQNALSFCMLLRKHIGTGVITSVEMVEGDRIIKFYIQAKNEMQDVVTYCLVIELISRLANIILLSHKGIILGAIKQFPLDASTRSIFPGLPYTLPVAGDKISPYDTTALTELFDNYSGGDVARYILDNVCGLAFSTVSHILFEAVGTTSLTELSNNQKADIIHEFDVLTNLEKYGKYQPMLSYQNGIPKEYYATKYNFLNAEFVEKDTLNTAISEFYLEKDTKHRILEHSKNISTVLKNAISRNEKKLSAQLQQLKDSADLEKDKINGELITSNIYKIKQGDSSVTVNNYYDENYADITIKLDKMLSPSKNAQSYYKRYAKKKRTIDNVELQVIDTEETLQMLYAIKSNLANLTSIDDVELIRNDLINAGIVKKAIQKKGKKEKLAKPQPICYEYDGYKIFVGRNSTENEYVTHTLGHNKDIWFHAKKNFGAHIIIKYENREISDDAIVFCSELAGFYSNSTDGSKVEIDYTEVRNVKKPPSNKLGMVIYNTNWSMLAVPNQHKEFIKD